MAKVDFNALHIDVKVGRKYRICGKCKEEMAVTVRCPVRERQNCKNVYVCCYCCWKCGYSEKTTQGRVCSIIAGRKERERQRRREAKVNKKKTVAIPQSPAVPAPFTQGSLSEES